MREIKFRAYHFRRKEMYIVDEINHIDTWSSRWMLWMNWLDFTIGIQGWEHNDCEIMQFTWLLDKNGKEIYTWDIVSFICDWEEYIWEVKDNFYHQSCVFIGWKIYHIDNAMKWEIIWNIYETPELIK